MALRPANLLFFFCQASVVLLLHLQPTRTQQSRHSHILHTDIHSRLRKTGKHDESLDIFYWVHYDRHRATLVWRKEKHSVIRSSSQPHAFVGLAGASPNTRCNPQKYLVKAMSFVQFPPLFGASKFVSVASHYVHFLLGSFAPSLKALGQEGSYKRNTNAAWKQPSEIHPAAQGIQVILKS